MAKKKKYTYKKFFKAIKKDHWRLSVFLLVIGFCLSIPPRLIYSFPALEKLPPLVREIDMEIPELEAYPVNKTGEKVPSISAESAIIVDVDSKAVIYQKYPDAKLAPASTTKMMTALVARDLYPLDQVASISAVQRIGQTMELVNGEEISIENLLKGMLILSANDAADQLARLDPDGKQAFMDKMNAKVTEFGLDDTHFMNPVGLDHYKHYSSVHDLAIIGAHVMDDPVLAKIVGTDFTIVTDTSGEIAHPLEAVNELLGIVPGLAGIKTGWTEQAGECLVSYTERGGHRIIVTLLGSYDRFGETHMLVEWVFNNFEWEEISLDDRN